MKRLLHRVRRASAPRPRDEPRVHAAPVGAGAGVGADADRRVERGRLAGVELVGQEVRGLQRRVPLRRHVVEADAVVERQLAVDLPVVLGVPLEVLVLPLRQRVLVGLRVGVEDAGRRVRVAEARVERVVRVVDEVDLAVEAREDALRLVAVLVVDAELGGVRSPDLGQVRERVLGGVLVRERAAVGLVLAGVARAAAAEAEVQGCSRPGRRPGRAAASPVRPAARRGTGSRFCSS